MLESKSDLCIKHLLGFGVEVDQVMGSFDSIELGTWNQICSLLSLPELDISVESTMCNQRGHLDVFKREFL